MITRKQWLQLTGYFGFLFIGSIAFIVRGYAVRTVPLIVLGIALFLLSGFALIKCIIWEVRVGKRGYTVDHQQQRLRRRYSFRPWERVYYPLLVLNVVLAISLYVMRQITQGIYSLVIGGVLAVVMEHRRYKRRKMHAQ